MLQQFSNIFSTKNFNVGYNLATFEKFRRVNLLDDGMEILKNNLFKAMDQSDHVTKLYIYSFM